ncbi:MAG: hypothetical protein ACRDUB_23840, partial [Mycobacterium sp.]
MGITAVNTISVSVGGLVSTTGPVVLTTTAPGAGNAITALGIIDSAAALTITTPRSIALNLVEAVSLGIDAASINLPAAVTTTGAAVLSAAATGNITLGSTFTVGGALTITRAKAIGFTGLVTADSVAIAKGPSDSVETISVGVGGITAEQDLYLRTTVAGTGNGITTAGTLRAGDASLLTLDSARSIEVNAALAGGTLFARGANLTLRGVTTVQDDVTLASPGTISIQSDLTAGDRVSVTQAGVLSFGAKLTASDLSVANTGSASFVGQVALDHTAVLSLTGDLTTSAPFSAGDSFEVLTVRDASFSGLVSSPVIRVGTTSARLVTV